MHGGMVSGRLARSLAAEVLPCCVKGCSPCAMDRVTSRTARHGDRRRGGELVQDDDVLARVRRLLEEKQYAEVVQLLRPRAEAAPEDAVAWELLGVAYSGLEQWEAAEEAARRVVHLQPENARAWSNWGTALRKLGRLDKAQEAQLQALKLDPAYKRAQAELRKIRAERKAGLPSRHGREAEQASVFGPEQRRACPHCGAAILPSDYRCLSCGANLEPSGERSAARTVGEASVPKRHSGIWTTATAAAAIVLAVGLSIVALHGKLAGVSGGAPQGSSGPTVPSGEQPRPAPPAPAVTPEPSSHSASPRETPPEAPAAPTQRPTGGYTAPVPAEEFTLRREALDALSSIRSAVQVGVSYVKYPDYVIQAKQRFDRALSGTWYKTGPFWQEASQCIEDYVFAVEAWGWKFKGDSGVEDFVGLSSPEGQLAMARYPQLGQSIYVISTPLLGPEILIEGIVQTAWESAGNHLEWARGLLNQP